MNASHNLQIGWASVDLTPNEPVQLSGQFHVRVSEGVLDHVTATALALSTDDGEESGSAVMVSCDFVTIPDSLRDAVRERVRRAVPELDPMAVFLNATHTHTGPEVRVDRDFDLLGGGISSTGIDIELPGMAPSAYVDFAVDRIAATVERAWRSREPGTLAYGLGHAVVGRNRRSVYEGGISRMYGDTGLPEFLHIEGYEDHDVNLLATWNVGGNLTGLVVNVACPSQVSEQLFEISADYWHDTRRELRRRFGDDVFVLPQCSAAGDQSPHIQVGEALEERMWCLAGRTERQEIAARIADAVGAVLPLIEKEPMSDPALKHHIEEVHLARRRLSQADVDEAVQEAEQLRAEYEERRQELEANPELQQQPRWYVRLTYCYRRMKWWEGVIRRFELEKTNPRFPMELHVLRLGDVVLATNAFEYYLDFGVRIKARSAAMQTFLVQLAGPGTYVPTERAVAGKSYGAIPASTPVGPEGGRELVEYTLSAIDRLFGAPDSNEGRG
ncbi:MAG: hypothetical protein ACP5JG_01160 [Anaerolineae bacterium]